MRYTFVIEGEKLAADPFESSRRKIARAKEHFADLKRKIQDFERIHPYESVVELHPDEPNHKVHKVKLTQALPGAIADVTADMAQNLRNALDNAGYAVSVASGRVAPKFTAFPFAGSLAQMPNSLGRSKDIPPQIQSLFCGFQPYPEGDDLLWALNEISVADKHKMVIPIGTAIRRIGAAVEGTGYVEIPDPHVWYRTKNEMVLFTTGFQTDYKYDFNFRVFVAFNEIRVVDGQPVLKVLDALSNKIEGILLAIEAEAHRLGVVAR